MSTQYICPSCGLPVEVDTDTLNWDADGNGRIVHNSCGKEITIARPVSQGFGEPKTPATSSRRQRRQGDD